MPTPTGMRCPRDFEALKAAGFDFAVVGNDIKNPPRVPTTNTELIRRTEKMHHPKRTEKVHRRLYGHKSSSGASELNTLTTSSHGAP